jgi:hypothetical protein
MTSETERKLAEAAEADSPPPVFGSWPRFYLFVVVNTFVVYLLLVLFSRFAR